VEQLKGRYRSIGKLNAVWSAGLGSWQQLLQKPYRPKGDLTSAAREDMGAFVKELAVRYYRTVRDTLIKYDPNHLYLGASIAWLVLEEANWATPEVEEAAVQYCDVNSFNAYAPPLDARWDFLKRLDKPTVIGEYNVGAPHGGVWYPGTVAATSQTDRARIYQEWVRSAVDRPTLVGCNFFLYIDEPLTGEESAGENLYSGFVTVTDGAYPEMVEAAKTVHAEVYRRRFSASASADASR
jgi:agarase